MAQDVQIKININTSDATQNIGSLNKIVKTLGAEFAKMDSQAKFDKLRKEISEAKKTVDALKAANVTSTKEFEKSVQAVNDLEAAYAELSRTNTDLNATFEDVAGELQPLSTRLGEIEDRLYELGLAGKQNTKEFQDLVKQAGRYRQTMVQTDMAVDSAALTMTQKLGGALEGVAAGFAIAQGAMGLFGTESEEVEKALLKVQSAMAILQGIQSIKETIPAIKGLRDSIVGLISPLTTQAAATGKVTVAQRVLNAVMNANPVFLVVAGITALVGAFAMFSSASEDAVEKTKKLNSELDQEIKILDNLVKFENMLRDTRIKREELANEKVRVGIEQEIDLLEMKTNRTRAENEKLKALRTDLFKHNKEALQQELNLAIDAFDTEVKAAREKRDKLWEQRRNLTKAIREADDEEAADLIKQEQELGEQADELTDFLANSFDERANIISDYKLRAIKLTNDREKELKAIEIKAREERLKREKEWADKQIAFFDAVEADRQANITDARERELQDAANHYDDMVALADAAGQSTVEITENYQNKVTAINKKYDLEALNSKKQLEAYIRLLNAETAMQEELNTAQTEQAKEDIRLKYAEQLKQLRIDQIQTERDILLTNTELTEEERQKIIAESNLKIAQLNEKQLEKTEETTEETYKSFRDLFINVGESWAEDWAVILERITDFTVNIGTQITGLLGDLFSQLNEEATNSLNRSTAERTEALDDELRNRLITEEEYARRIDELEDQKVQKERAIKKKQFNQDKALRITNAIMLGAQSVLAALATTPPASYILAGINAGLSAAQIGIISSQKFTAARGGIVPGDGPSTIDSVNALLAPGEAVINANSASMFPTLLSEINKAGGGVSLAPEPVSSMSTGSNNVFGGGETIVKAYVVENELTGTQRRVSRMESSSAY